MEALQPFVNCADTDWPLIVGWLVAAFRPSGPYPVLLLQGPQGSAKSTTTRLLLELVDPGNPVTHPLRLPTYEDDLAIMAHNHWVLAFDNLSGLSLRLSDALARLATGAGIARRRLYTDSEESLLSAARPIILNGIDEIAVRADLLDCAIRVECLPIGEETRRQEHALWQAFQRQRPQILGALFSAVGAALRNQHTVQLDHLPRTADFATWVAAAEPALPWPAGAFLQAYQANCAEAQTVQAVDDELARALIALFGNADRWEGTATELRDALRPYVRPEEDWWLPYATARGLSNAVRCGCTICGIPVHHCF